MVNYDYHFDTSIRMLIGYVLVFFVTVVVEITRRIKDRMIESQNRRLEELKQVADAANRTKSNFLATMSHELRTPMNAVIGMAAIGINAEETDRKHYALKRIKGTSRHLLGVINDILDMSKIEAGKLELSPIAFDLNHSLHKAVSLLQFAMEEKHIQFSINVGQNTPFHYLGDDQRLTQAITNLLSNAVKFTPENGEIKLAVSLLNIENNICELQFEVADSGIGMTTEQQSRLFNAFEQAESGTTRKFGGTGLGLVISKNIIELMNGRIWVESEYGKGSKFIFTVKLPLDKNNSHESNFETSNEITAGDIHKEVNGKKLLIVEDIDINREIIIALLDGTGLLIETAENGKEALDLVKSDPDKYDYIFMDIQMPVMDGYEATRQIRAVTQNRNKKLPIIAMTANVFQEEINKCHEAGMDDHVGKPIDLAAVFEKLLKYGNP